MKQIIIVFVCSFLLVFGCSASVESLVDESREYYRDGKYDKAISLCNEAIKKDKNYVWAYSQLAYCYVKLKRYDDAIDILTKAIKIDPNNEYPYGNRANVFIIQKKYNNAINDLEQAIKIKGDSDKGFGYCTLGDINILQNNYDKAIEKYNEAGGEKQSEACIGLARAYFHKNDYLMSMGLISKWVKDRYDEDEKYGYNSVWDNQISSWDGYLIYSLISFFNNDFVYSENTYNLAKKRHPQLANGMDEIIKLENEGLFFFTEKEKAVLRSVFQKFN